MTKAPRDVDDDVGLDADEAPPEAELYQEADPASIPPDEGDADADAELKGDQA